MKRRAALGLVVAALSTIVVAPTVLEGVVQTCRLVTARANARAHPEQADQCVKFLAHQGKY